MSHMLRTPALRLIHNTSLHGKESPLIIHSVKGVGICEGCSLTITCRSSPSSSHWHLWHCMFQRTLLMFLKDWMFA